MRAPCPTPPPAPGRRRSTSPRASSSQDTTDAATLFALQKYGLIYSRIANPTVSVFEERIASLEGGLGAVATASGQAAEFLTFAALTGAGDHIVAAAGLYGGTITQLDVTLRRFGVDTAFVAGDRPRTSPPRSPRAPSCCSRRWCPTRRATSPTSPRSPTWRTRPGCRW